MVKFNVECDNTRLNELNWLTINNPWRVYVP